MAKRVNHLDDTDKNSGEPTPGEDQGHSRGYARTDARGNPELFETKFDSPLYIASEELIKAKARLGTASDEFDQAEKAWIIEMKKINKNKVNHKGDIIEFVRGRTTDDHCRFKKS